MTHTPESDAASMAKGLRFPCGCIVTPTRHIKSCGQEGHGQPSVPDTAPGAIREQIQADLKARRDAAAGTLLVAFSDEYRKGYVAAMQDARSIALRATPSAPAGEMDCPLCRRGDPCEANDAIIAAPAGSGYLPRDFVVCARCGCVGEDEHGRCRGCGHAPSAPAGEPSTGGRDWTRIVAAQRAVEGVVERNPGKFRPTEIMAGMAGQHHASDVREAIWIALEEGTLRLTPDRHLLPPAAEPSAPIIAPVNKSVGDDDVIHESPNWLSERKRIAPVGEPDPGENAGPATADLTQRQGVIPSTSKGKVSPGRGEPSVAAAGELPPADAKLLRDNLWELYDTADPPRDDDAHTLADYIGVLATLAGIGHGRTARDIEQRALLLYRRMLTRHADGAAETREPVGQQTRESIAMHAMQDDVAVLLRLLGLGYHARNASPHRVMVDEIIPAVAALRATGERPDDAERAALRHQFGPSCAEVIAGERPEDGFLVSFVEAMKEGQVIDASDIDTLRRVALALRMGEKHHHQARERSEHERRTGGDAPLTGRDTRGAAVDANRDPCSGTTVESVEALRAELERRLVATLGPWVGGPYMQVAIGRSGDRTYCVFCDQESLHDDDCPALLLRTTAPGGEGESE